MLMIRRRAGESILLGESVEIQVLEIAGNRVKIGISAPRELLVLRKELRLTEEFNRDASRNIPAERLRMWVAAGIPHLPAQTPTDTGPLLKKCFDKSSL